MASSRRSLGSAITAEPAAFGPSSGTGALQAPHRRSPTRGRRNGNCIRYNRTIRRLPSRRSRGAFGADSAVDDGGSGRVDASRRFATGISVDGCDASASSRSFGLFVSVRLCNFHRTNRRYRPMIPNNFPVRRGRGPRRIGRSRCRCPDPTGASFGIERATAAALRRAGPALVRAQNWSNASNSK